MSQQHHGAPREARNVASSAGTGQALHFFVAMAPSGVEIAETIHFGGAEKADVHAALLQQAHHVEHRAALRGTAQIRRIAHGVEQFGGRSFAEHAIFKKAHRTRRVRAARDEEGEHRQAHADEYEFAISDFTRGSGYHQFTEGVATRREIGFGASHYDCALSFFRMSQAQREYCAINFLRMAAQPPETVCGALWNLHWCGRAERAAENRQPVSQSVSTSMPASVPLEIGFTFLEERVQAFQTIMRFEAMPLQADLFVERRFEFLAVFLNHAMFY